MREGTKESVFVKNIENIQGDERDVILISVCYGPSTPGSSLSSMSFGPVNSDGGERRLNVLFTRARLRCEIFASFDPEEIDLSRARGDGTRIFKSYLDFAKSGKLQQPIPTGEPSETPLEEDVAEVIRGFGFLADPQVGSAGFRIDLGVRHPSRPGTYLLAVECDGATYHHALWARERDRLRQDVLEGLGWQFHRIWSTDWFYRRTAEIARLHAALQTTLGSASAMSTAAPAAAISPSPPVTPDQPSVHQEAPKTEDPPTRSPQVVPYTRAVFPVESALEPHQADARLLSRLARQIVEAEGPIHEEEVGRRIAASFGRDRAGNRILAAAREALVRAAKASGDLLHEEDFWFTRQQRETPPIRDRALEEGATLRPEHISLLEIRAALALARADNAGVSPPELIRAAARFLGFRRVGSELQVRISQGLH